MPALADANRDLSKTFTVAYVMADYVSGIVRVRGDWRFWPANARRTSSFGGKPLRVDFDIAKKKAALLRAQLTFVLQNGPTSQNEYRPHSNRSTAVQSSLETIECAYSGIRIDLVTELGPHPSPPDNVICITLSNFGEAHVGDHIVNVEWAREFRELCNPPSTNTGTTGTEVIFVELSEVARLLYVTVARHAIRRFHFKARRALADNILDYARRACDTDRSFTYYAETLKISPAASFSCTRAIGAEDNHGRRSAIVKKQQPGLIGHTMYSAPL